MKRLIPYTLIAFALAATLRMNLFTLGQIQRAKTSMPWWDEWAFIGELIQHRQGRPLWPILWSSYWGHRFLIPRLLLFANSLWGALSSLTWLTLLIQFVHIGLLIKLAWMLIGRKSKTAAIVGCIVIFNLMLSPLQMQNFVWSLQTTFPLNYAAATAAFVCLAWGASRGLLLAIVFGLIGSYTMPNGLLVWPILLLQAWFLRLGRRVITALAAIGTVVIGTYFWHYQRPEMGMGVIGSLRDPIHSIMLLGLLLGGPIDSISIPAAIALTILSLIGAAYVTFRNFDQNPWLSAIVAVVLFLFLTAASIVAGRLDPRWLRGGPSYPIHSRYFTLIDTFWASVAVLIIYACWIRNRRPIVAAVYAVFFCFLMFATYRRQFVSAEDWADFFRGCDALGSAVILDAHDEKLLSLLWPNRQERDDRVAFLRGQHLAMFAEPRAKWPGTHVVTTNRCRGAIEKTIALDGSWRVQGWAWDERSGRSPDDILIGDPSGRIVGLARGGLRHGYIPGLLIESSPTPPAHVRYRDSEFLGYAKQGPPEQWTLYGVLHDERHFCAIQ